MFWVSDELIIALIIDARCELCIIPCAMLDVIYLGRDDLAPLQLTLFIAFAVRKARKSAQSYYLQYAEAQPVSQLVKQTASVMQEYTQSGGVRPFGISLLVAGTEGDGTPRLYQVDPSGAYFGWKATAIGKNYVNAKNFLEKRYQDDMELEDAIHTALLTLREGFEGEMNSHNIDVGVVRNGKFVLLTPAQIQDYLDEAN